MKYIFGVICFLQISICYSTQEIDISMPIEMVDSFNATPITNNSTVNLTLLSFYDQNDNETYVSAPQLLDILNEILAMIDGDCFQNTTFNNCTQKSPNNNLQGKSIRLETVEIDKLPTNLKETIQTAALQNIMDHSVINELPEDITEKYKGIDGNIVGTFWFVTTHPRAYNQPLQKYKGVDGDIVGTFSIIPTYPRAHNKPLQKLAILDGDIYGTFSLVTTPPIIQNQQNQRKLAPIGDLVNIRTHITVRPRDLTPEPPNGIHHEPMGDIIDW